jgi:hypothetical protein|uniref:Uncharacterized protein n=1 Tax=Caudovirales sp. ctVfb8 TaxID=2825766 RepID=A0A8S5V3E6_9CAUD|nr:MAG TPA: hypothetical protein [Caudovirales sp. ctVfb8]
MDNNALLLLMGAKEIKQNIGKAGQQGFGVGVYSGDPTDLARIELYPMEGCEDPTSANYGNYIHLNGSVMVFIPAFCYRIGNTSAPSYSRDGANALEIRDASLGEGDGWILHRAFIDGGVQKFGFFVDKYLCSKYAKDENIAVSVKGGNQISLSSMYEKSSSMAGCYGVCGDAINLSRARGEAYACMSVFQWSALSMLSLAHGQAATSVENCAWYDANYVYNFPKGSNRYTKDINDSSVTFTPHLQNESFGRTGSGTPFAKTTHNGQACGVADVNGCMWQPLLGLMLYETSGTVGVVKEACKMHNFTPTTYGELSDFDSVSGFSDTNPRWGSGSNCVFPTETSGARRALCGVLPVSGGASTQGTELFGNDLSLFSNDPTHDVFAAGNYSNGNEAGVWCRSVSLSWFIGNSLAGFRAAGYAN